jgi:hypothetical protein
LKYFRESSSRHLRLAALSVFFAAVFGAVAALGELPSWIRNIDASTALEGVFFRMISPDSAGNPSRACRIDQGAAAQC